MLLMYSEVLFVFSIIFKINIFLFYSVSGFHLLSLFSRLLLLVLTEAFSNDPWLITLSNMCICVELFKGQGDMKDPEEKIHILMK